LPTTRGFEKERTHRRAGSRIGGAWPFCRATVWFANKLAEFEQTLAAGSVFILSTLSRAVPVEAGDVIVASLEGLGSVSATFM
jgi:2-keto-4-pentenoate hydratase